MTSDNEQELVEKIADAIMAEYYGLKEMPDYKLAEQKKSDQYSQCLRYAAVAIAAYEGALKKENESLKKQWEGLKEYYEALQPIEDWTEDDGNVLWWCLPICEPPYCGTPYDTDFRADNGEGYFTHFSYIIRNEVLERHNSEYESKLTQNQTSQEG